jgi:hypothetical protein
MGFIKKGKGVITETGVFKTVKEAGADGKESTKVITVPMKKLEEKKEEKKG